MASESPAKQKVTKKILDFTKTELRVCLPEGKHLAFLEGPKGYDWKVITACPGNIGPEILNISRLVALVLGRQWGEAGNFLRGVRYDSPEILIQELKEIFGYEKPFAIDLI